MDKIRYVVPVVFLAGTLLLIILATGKKDLVEADYHNLILWIQSDYPGLINEKEILEIFPELKKIKEKITKRENLKTRYYDCLRNPCGAYKISNDQLLVQYSKQIRDLQFQIHKDLEVFVRSNNISTFNH